MEQSEARRQRLAELLDLAQKYQGWTRKELAKTLGRDPTKLIPGSGVPKLDLVVDLSGVLDWPVDDVVGYLMFGSEAEGVSTESTDEFEVIDAAAREAYRAGDPRKMIELAQQSFKVAKNAEQRARACNREAGGWDSVGRYTQVLLAVQRGIKQSPLAPEYRRMLQSNLAVAYYNLWSLVEARALAFELTAHYAVHSPISARDRKNEAFAEYVLGHTYRRMISTQPADESEHLAASARPHLQRSHELYSSLAKELEDESLLGIARACEGGLLEVEVVLGIRDAHEVLAQISDGLDEIDEDEPVVDRLESHAWWCIFGCNVALRSLQNERELQQHMAVFTNKADEIAERLDDWSIRERVFTMEHSRWERAVGCTGFDIPRIVDEEEVRVITGTMARFPTFRETGWQILRTAKVIRAN